MSGEVLIEAEERGAGRPVLFVHGLTFDRAMLRECSEPLFAEPAGLKCRRLYVDLPGHGSSPADERAASAEGLVAALLAWYDRTCGAEPPVIVGHSYGAYLALGVAACRPTAGLVLFTPVVEPDVAKRAPAAKRVLRDETPLRYLPGEPERATFEEVAVVQSATVLAGYQRLVQPASERTDRTFLQAVRGRYVFPAAILSRIDLGTPVSLVCARDDHWCGYTDALSLVRAFPRCELTVVPEAGQLLPLEQPERYRALLDHALRRTLTS